MSQRFNLIRSKFRVSGIGSLTNDDIHWLVRKLEDCARSLIFYSIDEFYDASSYDYESPIQVLGEPVKKMRIDKSPIMYDHGRKARVALFELEDLLE